MDMIPFNGTIGAADLPMDLEAAAATSVSGGMQLAELPTGATARVACVSAPQGSSGSTDVHRRLAELGFLPGEKVRIVARGLMGREPIAVRIGTGTFALRLFEAAYIRVIAEPSQPR